MGAFDLAELEAYTDTDDVARYAPSSKVGSVSAHRDAEVMRIGVGDDGEPFFEGEETVDLYALEHNIGPHAWWRLEMRARPDAPPTPNERDDLVFTEYPWRGSASFVPFRKGRNRGEHERYEHLIQDDLATTLAAIEASDYEPFQSSGRLAVAGISSPTMSYDIRNRQTKRIAYVFGVLERARREAVTEHLMSFVRRTLLPAAKAGKLVNPYTHGSYRKIEDDELLEELANDSVREALAGPATPRKSEKYAGQPVSLLVDDIFRYHVQRNLDARRQREQAMAKLMSQSKDGDVMTLPVEGGAEAIEALLRERKDDVRFRRKLAALLSRMV